MIAEYDGSLVSLRRAMAMRLYDAAGDLREVSAGKLYGRFLAWIRPASSAG